MITSAPGGDLFSLAGAIDALVRAPVTIEDLTGRVLAFSGHLSTADEPRVQTILSRQVPECYRRVLEERGILTEIYRSREAVYLELAELGVARLAVAVRAGEEILGTIWAAVGSRPEPARTRAFAESTELVALAMLRQRVDADVERRLRTELVATTLDGGPEAFEAAGRLELPVGPITVLALGIRSPGLPRAQAEADRHRLADALSVHLSALHPQAVCAPLGTLAYGLLPVPAACGDAESHAQQVALEFLQRTGSRTRCAIGISRVAGDVAELARCRVDADRALRVAWQEGGSRRVARIGEVYPRALLLELSDRARSEPQPPTGPLASLRAYDAQHAAQLVPSLRAWLDAFGDVNAAAAAVHVHPSTFRYRLRRIREVGGVDLADPEQRFAIMLHLRLPPGGP